MAKSINNGPKQPPTAPVVKKHPAFPTKKAPPPQNGHQMGGSKGGPCTPDKDADGQ